MTNESRIFELNPSVPISNKMCFTLESVMTQDVLNGISDKAGIYAFWLDKRKVDLSKFNLTVEITGKKRKGGRQFHSIIWDWNLDKEFIPLYIGKSTVIGKRIRQHLDAYSVTDWFENAPKNPKNLLFRRKSTVNQFRAGLEQLFRGTNLKKNNISTLEYMQKSIFITYLELGSEETLISDRFYLEDFAIGYYKPWFNVDSER